LCRLIDVFGFEIDTVGRLVAGHLARHPGYLAILVIPGVGPTLSPRSGMCTGSPVRGTCARGPGCDRWRHCTPFQTMSD
jgi:hypothetical protein